MSGLMQRVTDELPKRQDLGLLFLRVGVGIILMAHGTTKLADPVGTAAHFANLGIPMPWVATPLAIAGEFVGGLGLLLGAWTRLSALGPLVTMVVAIVTVHLGNGLFAKNGGWEYPLVLSLVALLFVVRGGGVHSLDAWLARVRAGRTARDSPMNSPVDPVDTEVVHRPESRGSARPESRGSARP
jgi:putative oxidoreductase